MSIAELTSQEAEQSVIGACLLDSKAIARVIETVSADDFFTFEHRVVWAAIVSLHNAGQHIDLVTVADKAEADAESGVGLAYIAELTKNAPSTANARAYAEIVADLGQRRRLAHESREIAAQASDKTLSVGELVDDAQGRFSRLVRADADQAGPMADDLESMVDELDRKWNGELTPMGASFGLTDLDRRTMGMHPGQLIIVGGRPGQGKTAFALNILRTCCVRDKRPAVIFSMEMDRRALRNRMTAAIADIPMDAIRDPKQHMTDEHWGKLAPAVKLIKDAPLIVDDRAAMSASQIRSAAKRWRDRYGDMGVIMVDYLQLMGNDNSSNKQRNREQEVAEISRNMKLIAKEMGCPVVALSQLNRGLESRTDKRPMMADLRESGSLEQDADLILFLYRDEYYNEGSPMAGVAEVIIGKQREGSTGTVYAASKLAHARFDDLVPEEIIRMRELAEQPAPKKQKSAMADF